MSYILQVDFPYTGPWGEAMTQAMQGLARSIAQEPGLIWKIWTANEALSRMGAWPSLTHRFLVKRQGVCGAAKIARHEAVDGGVQA